MNRFYITAKITILYRKYGINQRKASFTMAFSPYFVSENSPYGDF